MVKLYDRCAKAIFSLVSDDLLTGLMEIPPFVLSSLLPING